MDFVKSGYLSLKLVCKLNWHKNLSWSDLVKQHERWLMQGPNKCMGTNYYIAWKIHEFLFIFFFINQSWKFCHYILFIETKN